MSSVLASIVPLNDPSAGPADTRVFRHQTTSASSEASEEALAWDQGTFAPSGRRPDGRGERIRGELGAGEQGRGQQGRGEQGRGGRGRGDDDEKKEKPGIPVTHSLVMAHCSACHTPDARGHLSRISYMRKSPEGWSITLKRMIRLYDVRVSPDEAKQMVRYLASEHGLTRSEAARGLYESERRVHWSEEQEDEDLQQACSQCHTLGRVFNQQRDEEEWKLLRATHVAYFPLSRRQVGGGPPPSSEERRFFGGGGGEGRRRESPADRADRVLKKLAEEQPLFSDEWESWSVNEREVPVAGTWTVKAHQVGHGDGVGSAVLKRTAEDEYEVLWHIEFDSGHRIERTGRGVLYAGYSWRGRSVEPATAAKPAVNWREVLLLSDDWRGFRGRIFTGGYDEIGIDVELMRHDGTQGVHLVRNRFVTVPAKGVVLDLLGEGFEDGLTAADLHLGAGVRVQAVEVLSATQCRVTVDVDAKASLGPRKVSLGLDPGSAEIFLYDAIDYIRVGPVQGLARIGGIKHPAQTEHFEAIARHRGEDGKPFTDDDIDLMTLPATWALSEFHVREGDDDVQYVGVIDSATGAFTPGVDGPNPERRWQANNVGDVYVEAVCTVMTPVRAESDEDKAALRRAGEPNLVEKTFRARGHLLVTVPLYTRWNTLDWESR